MDPEVLPSIELKLKKKAKKDALGLYSLTLLSWGTYKGKRKNKLVLNQEAIFKTWLRGIATGRLWSVARRNT